VGVAFVVLFVRQMLRTAGLGPTLLEISGHPLVPGARYRVFVSQSGRAKIGALDLLLVCEEEAAYRQGTNTRIETRQVYRQQLARREASGGQEPAPREAEWLLDVPTAAMHSVKAEHNAVNWKLIVEVDGPGQRRFSRSFAVVVHPRQAAAGLPRRPDRRDESRPRSSGAMPERDAAAMDAARHGAGNGAGDDPGAEDNTGAADIAGNVAGEAQP
jgi:hypothetical protein